jgi:hypothetical protein
MSSTDSYFYADEDETGSSSTPARQTALVQSIQSGVNLSSQMAYTAPDLEQLQQSANAKNPYRMPDVTGMSLRKALLHLYALDLDVDIDGYGQVVRQHPSAGTHIAPSSRVLIELED